MYEFRSVTDRILKHRLLQHTLVSSETMKAAQKAPDEYKDLVVRIAGYSAYFTELTPDCQNDIISRTENAI